MHLFIIGWNIPEKTASIQADHASRAIGEIYDIFPQLDKKAQKSIIGQNSFIISLQPDQAIVSPRRYITEVNGQTLLYSGTMFDHEGSFDAHDADQLAAHWNELPEVLDGAFVCIRISSTSNKLELITDLIGMEQVYYCVIGKSTFISNNLFLLENVSGLSSIDPVGLSMFLSIQFPFANRTIIEGMHSIPGGRILRWEGDQTEPYEFVYYSLIDYIEKRKSLKPDIGYLQNSLIQTCKSLGKYSNDLLCPLTGGRDSRLLLALFKTAGLSVKYYTYGEESGDDIQIPKQIVQRLNLDYEFLPVYQQDIIQRWDYLCERLIRQNDGMVCLWQMQDVLYQQDTPKSFPVILPGYGGEIARGFVSSPEYFLFGNQLSYSTKFIFDKLLMPDSGLLKSETVKITRNVYNDFCSKVLNQGFSPLEAMYVFYVLGYLPVWGGFNYRKYQPNGYTFSPMLTRAFVDTAFLMKPRERYLEPLHYQLIKRLAPEVSDIPFARGPWRYQGRNLYYAFYFSRWPLRQVKRAIKKQLPELFHKIVLSFNQHAWFETQIHDIRAVCLDIKSSSLLWDYIDREKFEKMLSAETSSEEREKCIESLYTIFTSAYYLSGR